jgi:membrane-bound serine protease (ClpP class)
VGWPSRSTPNVGSDPARWPAAARRLLVLAGVLLVAAPLRPTTAGAQTPEDPPSARRVLATTVDDTIGPVIAEHVAEGIGRAADRGYDAYLIRIDTPGGLDTSMRRIVREILGSSVPVIVHVSPQGARAASAGAIITFAAHVAAMAPGTAIGAATPVSMEGGDLDQKIVNDAAALAESLAALRDRDVDFAVDTVREGRSASADEALEIGAIDLVVGSTAELLDAVDGRPVTLADGRTVELRTAGAVVDEHGMGLFRQIQQVLADPNLAFIFLSIGTLGLLYELASPGIGVGGVLGVTFIILAMFSLAVLPVSAVGLLFLLLAAALFVAELFAPGVGLAAAGGGFFLVLSGVFLFRDAPGVQVSLAVVVPVALVVVGAVVLAGRLVVRSRRGESDTTGAGGLTGREVVVLRAAGRSGQALLDGAWWTVRSAGGDLTEGATVRVVAVEGIELVVEPEVAGAPGPTATGGT